MEEKVGCYAFFLPLIELVQPGGVKLRVLIKLGVTYVPDDGRFGGGDGVNRQPRFFAFGVGNGVIGGGGSKESAGVEQYPVDLVLHQKSI